MLGDMSSTAQAATPPDDHRRAFMLSLAAVCVAGLAGCNAPQRAASRTIGFFSPPIPGNLTRFETEVARQFGPQGRVTIRFIDGTSPETITAASGQNLDLAVAASAAIAARLRTHCPQLPVVFASGTNPVDEGLAESFERPNKGATGFTYVASTDGRCAELLRACAPTAKRVGVVVDEWYLTAEKFTAPIYEAFAGVNMVTKLLVCNKGSQLPDTILKFKQMGVDVIYFPMSSAIEGNEQLAADLLRTHKLPAIFPYASCAEKGGLISYEATIPEPFEILVRQSALVLKGVPVGEIPIESPQNFRCAVNFETARRIGVTVPLAIALSADVQFGGRGI